MKLKEIAAMLGGELEGEGELEIEGVADIEEAGPGQCAFVSSERRLKAVGTVRASAVVAPPGLPVPVSAVRVTDPQLAFGRLVRQFHPPSPVREGVSDKAYVGRGVKMGERPAIYPWVYLEDGVVLGARVVIHPGVYVGRGVRIGDECLIYPNVCILEGVELGCRVVVHAGAVIGSDGFGFLQDEEGRHHKIPQVGKVVIGDDVEIGANTTIDRATMGVTLIGRGTKIDNLVQIAHNVRVGEDSIMAAQVGISGSCTIGRRVMFGGQVGVADHVTVGDQAKAGGKAGLHGRIPSGAVYMGIPAIPVERWRRAQAALSYLPELLKRVRRLEEEFERLGKGRSHDGRE